MTENSRIRSSIVEYDIAVISRVAPGQISHLGIRAEIDGQVIGEWNFGSFLNGDYRAVGLPSTRETSLEGSRGR